MRLRRLVRIRSLDLQYKISLVLVGVILPTFIIITFAQNKLIEPLLDGEMRQIGVTAGKTLAAEIVANRLLALPNPTPAIEGRLQEFLYTQPNILRLDVIVPDRTTGIPLTLATTIEEDPAAPPHSFPLVESMTAQYREDSDGHGVWEVNTPIERQAQGGPRRFLGTVRVLVSTAVIERITDTVWRTTAAAAAFSVVTLLLFLSYFLRKTIADDRKLRQAESQNVMLTERLHEAQRELMNTEKLAVMGQLTASFAHEIGTPLTAIGGHLQLLGEEVGGKSARLEIIHGQVAKIEGIVKGFLQSTAKPASQRQLVDLGRIAEKTLEIVRPRAEALAVHLERHLDRDLGPMRLVPLDLEQILLNLLNNSLDSLRAKGEPGRLEISTGRESRGGREWALVTVQDTGEGIPKADIDKVLKPFFTTKRPGEGTGLGLTICQQLAHKYGGALEIESREGAWTRVTVKLPFMGNT
jgi:signal transduction histidine kinase